MQACIDSCKCASITRYRAPASTLGQGTVQWVAGRGRRGGGKRWGGGGIPRATASRVGSAKLQHHPRLRRRSAPIRPDACHLICHLWPCCQNACKIDKVLRHVAAHRCGARCKQQAHTPTIHVQERWRESHDWRGRGSRLGSHAPRPVHTAHK